ncbi:hypothetical protein KCU98_g5469, partial [Aureobasidium melanogenum]
MSEPFSDKEKSNMDTALHSSRLTMPFIEEDEDFTSKIKAEDDGRHSPLFEPQGVLKRNIEDTAPSSQVKKPKVFTQSGPRAYGGGPVRHYIPGKPYNYSRHETVPQLEVNSQHHLKSIENFLYNIKEVVLPALLPYRDEDKSISDTVEWFEKHSSIPAIPPVRFAISGAAGSGKTSTLNNILGKPGLATADCAMKSVTQNPQIFNHGVQKAMFRVEVLFHNSRTIQNLVEKCVTDLITFFKSTTDDETEGEDEYIRESAESSRQIVDDLFSHQEGLKNLDYVEDFLESKNLLPQDDEKAHDSAVDALYDEIKARATAEGVDWDNRSLELTAENIGELHAKTAKFSERGGFAPLVSSIRTKFYSPVLSMGIEIADLPGYTDTNFHLRKTSMAYSINCPKAIFVTRIDRCLTDPEVGRSLREIIRLKGAENVCLVISRKEEVESGHSRWSKDEIAHSKTLEGRLKIAKSQIHDHDENIAAQATVDMRNIEQQILEHRMNTPLEKTGFLELREYMCETPSRDLVRAFARHSTNCLTRMRRISIWADGPKLPPQDAAMALFQQHARWGVDGYEKKLSKVTKQYEAAFNMRVSIDAVHGIIDGWTTKYAARTQGVFIRQGGRHSPSGKGSKTKKPQLVSWVEDLLSVVEDDVIALLDSTFRVIDDIDGSICESVFDIVEKIRHGLEMLDTIGGANLEGVFEIFEQERKLCARDIKESIDELKTKMRQSTADEPPDEDSPIFVKVTAKILTTTFERFPPKTKNITKERVKHIREQIINPKGPYSKMAHEISTNLANDAKEWAKKASERIEKMHTDLRDVLFKSFEGKKMSDARREQIAPSIKAAMEKARAVLQADLDGYAADVL